MRYEDGDSYIDEYKLDGDAPRYDFTLPSAWQGLMPQPTKAETHRRICEELNDQYKAKNADYGDSFAAVRRKYKNAIMVRLWDKINRLETLLDGRKAEVDESIDDTLRDLANYCIMELVERRAEGRGAGGQIDTSRAESYQEP